VSTLDALATLEHLLVEERGAIVRLDATQVARIAAEKEALIARLREGLPALGAEHRARLRALRDGLRQNTILLAHARDCLRDALAAFHREDLVGGKASRATPRPGARISVRG
jgi:aspartate aminotransferase-like enzyme